MFIYSGGFFYVLAQNVLQLFIIKEQFHAQHSLVSIFNVHFNSITMLDYEEVLLEVEFVPLV